MLNRIQYFLLLILFCVSTNSAEITQPTTEAFLKQHWPKSGIPLQGTKPDNFSPIEASLAPSECKLCHSQQFKDWQNSRHASSMGAGVLGQLPSLLKNDPESARDCFRCHTPLSEQQNILQNKNGEWHKNKHFNKKLQHQGLICAGCHIRKWQRFGPPRQNTPSKTGDIGKGTLPHNGFTANNAFNSSKFCKTCHQFGKNGYSLNGKPLENTFYEWSQTRFAKQGTQCQNCHMPDRRHLWLGIHDKKTVQDSLKIETVLNKKKYTFGDSLSVNIIIKNTGVGHHFPTYVTPKVFVRAYLLDSNGTIQNDSLQEAVIGRGLSSDMSTELYDTRIPAGDSMTIEYRQKITQPNMTLRIEIEVEPDHFYEQFFLSMDAKTGELLHTALLETQQSHYRLYDQSIPLGRDTVPLQQNQPPFKKHSTENAINPVDWNEEKLTWHNYEDALQVAKQTGQSILFILYADWCPTCHAYKNIFYNKRIIDATGGVILARANVDKRHELSTHFNLDGEYIPQTYLLNAKGTVIEAAYEGKPFPRYFLNADSVDDFLSLINYSPLIH